jgi:hypothetical protein
VTGLQIAKTLTITGERRNFVAASERKRLRHQSCNLSPTGRWDVSTLNEMAANYARMAKALEDAKCVSVAEELDVLALAILSDKSNALNEQFSTFAKGAASAALTENLCQYA